MEATVSIRPARPEEAGLLTTLALESKASWGYSAGFMERVAPVLAVTADYIREHPVFVAEADGTVAGFYSSNDARYQVELDLLFVRPAAFRRGIGRALLEHARAAARADGHPQLFVESDPGAEPFYLALGGIRIGAVASTVEAGRELPLLRFDLRPATAPSPRHRYT